MQQLPLPSGDMGYSLFIKPWSCCVVCPAQKENSALRKSLDHDVEEREVEIRTLRSDNQQLKKQLIKLVRWASFLDHDLVSVFVSLSFPFQQCVFFQGSAGIVLSCLVMTVFDANGLSGHVCVCVCVHLYCHSHAQKRIISYRPLCCCFPVLGIPEYC